MVMSIQIPFTKPTKSGTEESLLTQCLSGKPFSSNGTYTRHSNEIVRQVTGTSYSSLVPSCTAGLEAIFIALGIKQGDEVIMPSFTFSSTANAVALRGATPVFVDIEYMTMNIDPSKLLEAIGKKTKAILVVHYAGVSAEMDTILDIAKQCKLPVIEDAAQCFGSSYRGRHLGSLGLAGAFSFHSTKNITCGEGGAIITSSNVFANRLKVIVEKGTNRQAFLENEVSKYQWIDLGSSYILNEISAAMLSSQLKEWENMTSSRLARWKHYFDTFKKIDSNQIRMAEITAGAKHNGHIFFFHVKDAATRTMLLSRLKAKGIQATSHFEPLHKSIAGKRYGRASGKLEVTESAAGTLVRLPLWNNIKFSDQDLVISAVCEILQIG